MSATLMTFPTSAGRLHGSAIRPSSITWRLRAAAWQIARLRRVPGSTRWHHDRQERASLSPTRSDLRRCAGGHCALASLRPHPPMERSAGRLRPGARRPDLDDPDSGAGGGPGRLGDDRLRRASRLGLLSRGRARFPPARSRPRADGGGGGLAAVPAARRKSSSWCATTITPRSVSTKRSGSNRKRS